MKQEFSFKNVFFINVEADGAFERGFLFAKPEPIFKLNSPEIENHGSHSHLISMKPFDLFKFSIIDKTFLNLHY